MHINININIYIYHSLQLLDGQAVAVMDHNKRLHAESRVIGTSIRSRIFLYTAPVNSITTTVSVSPSTGNSDPSVNPTVAFIVICKGDTLISPISFPTLLALLDAACMPLKVGRAMLPMFNLWLNPEKFLLASAPQAPYLLPKNRYVCAYVADVDYADWVD